MCFWVDCEIVCFEVLLFVYGYDFDVEWCVGFF